MRNGAETVWIKLPQHETQESGLTHAWRRSMPKAGIFLHITGSCATENLQVLLNLLHTGNLRTPLDKSCARGVLTSAACVRTRRGHLGWHHACANSGCGDRNALRLAWKGSQRKAGKSDWQCGPCSSTPGWVSGWVLVFMSRSMFLAQKLEVMVTRGEA